MSDAEAQEESARRPAEPGGSAPAATRPWGPGPLVHRLEGSGGTGAKLSVTPIEFPPCCGPS